MKNFIKRKYLYLLLSLTMLSGLAVAQGSKINVELIDESYQPITNVKVSVGGSYLTETNARGTVTLEPRKEISNGNISLEDIKVAAAYRIKDYKFLPDTRTLRVVLQPSSILRGSVVAINGGPLPNAKVQLQGVASATAQTNAEGGFVMTIPGGYQISAQSTFLVNGSPVPSQQTTFQNNFGTVVLKEPKPQGRVKQLYLRSRSGQAIAQAKVQINGKTYQTANNGLVFIENQTLDNKLRLGIEDYQEVNRKYNQAEEILTIYCQSTKPVAATTPNPVRQTDPTNNSLNEDFNRIIGELKEDRRLQKERSEKIKSELNDLYYRLSLTPNMSPAQRAELQTFASTLEETFLENDEIYRRLQEETKLKITEMQRLLAEKDSLREVAEKKVEKVVAEKEALELEKRLSELRSRNNIIILSLASFMFLVIAVVFFIYSRIVRRQKDELQITKNQLDEKIIEINQKNDQIVAKNQELTTTYTKIKSSIFSAERIQSAILDNPQEVLSHFADGFIFFSPRDIVSGDFYWYYANQDEIIVSAIDCTGHGVPGAFMTMLGNSLLNQIVKEDNITDPATILTILDQKVQETLHQQERETASDGMDMVLLNINKATNIVRFAGAKNPLYVVKDEELSIFKGANIPIGSTLFKDKDHFENHTLILTGGEKFYLMSDGYQDQFGGINNSDRPKKYMKKRLRQLILDNSDKPMSEQKEILKQEFETWKGERSQTDDVIVIGLEI